IAAVAARETWRWRMQDGRTTEHRDFWISLVHWAAAGRDSLTARPEHAFTALGQDVRVRIDAARETPQTIDLVRPDGTVEKLPVAQLNDERIVRFVAAD